MANKDILYSGQLENGVKFEVHQATGFSKKCDLAIKIHDEFVSVMTVSVKQSGNIEISPVNLGRRTIKVSDEIKPTIETPPDLLADVIPQNKQ